MGSLREVKLGTILYRNEGEKKWKIFFFQGKESIWEHCLIILAETIMQISWSADCLGKLGLWLRDFTTLFLYI